MWKKFFITTLLGGSMMLFSFVGLASAQGVDPFSDICKQAPIGKDKPAACQDKELNGQNPLYGPDGLITKIVNLMSIIIGLAAVISVMYAGLKMVTSGDNSDEVGKAREWVVYAMLGLMFAAISQLLVRLVLLKIG